jgi:hypothetical protein
VKPISIRLPMGFFETNPVQAPPQELGPLIKGLAGNG